MAMMRPPVKWLRLFDSGRTLTRLQLPQLSDFLEAE
jgi:hypothetical protein